MQCYEMCTGGRMHGNMTPQLTTIDIRVDITQPNKYIIYYMGSIIEVFPIYLYLLHTLLTGNRI